MIYQQKIQDEFKNKNLLSLEEAFCVIYGCRQSYCINLDYFDYYTVLYKMNLRTFIFVLRKETEPMPTICNDTRIAVYIDTLRKQNLRKEHTLVRLLIL